jgi:pyruvate,orthophosphate dikinase
MAIEFYPITESLLPENANKEFLGSKGYFLWWMAQQGLPVPPAVVLPTTVCREYWTKPKSVMREVRSTVIQIAAYFQKQWGYMPLLAVRSGAANSMPGMMDTILNVGLDPANEEFWRKRLGDSCYDNCRHRLITMYGDVVKGLDRQELKDRSVQEALAYYQKAMGEFPGFRDQLVGAVEAVLKSWNTDRAKFYRSKYKISDDGGTAVVIQAMVFGNLNKNSGSGVMFTRNPITGENEATGNFLAMAQGEDVVGNALAPNLKAMGKSHPKAAKSVLALATKLEHTLKDMQDVEFTVQDGEVWLLQTRTGKREVRAAVKIAYDMVHEQLITVQEAVKRANPRQLDLLQQRAVAPTFTKAPTFIGMPACSGAVVGKPVFTAQAAIDCQEPCILVRKNTDVDDIEGMVAAAGILAMTGSETCHPAIVARGMNKPCVVALKQSLEVFNNVDRISIDGATGRVWLEAVPMVEADNTDLVRAFQSMMIRALDVVPVSDTPIEGVNTVFLDLGGRLHDQGLVLSMVMAALDAADTVYVDCRWADRPEAERSMMDMFYHNCKYEQQFVQFLDEHVPAEKLSKLVLLTNQKPTKIQVMSCATGLADLIMANGWIAIEPGHELGFADPQVSKVLSWQKADGLQILYLNHHRADGRSVLSPEQVMQLLG